MQILTELIKTLIQTIQGIWEIITNIFTGITYLYELISDLAPMVGKYLGIINLYDGRLGAMALATFSILIILFILNRLGEGN